MEGQFVYLVWWMPYDRNGNLYEDFGYDDVKLIGTYSTRLKAESAIERASNLPGFRMHPESFVIDEYVIDKDEWTSGFVFESPDGSEES